MKIEAAGCFCRNIVTCLLNYTAFKVAAFRQKKNSNQPEVCLLVSKDIKLTETSKFYVHFMHIVQTA